ncbi:MAG TPA: histidine kinase dimerization/phospho-acceptor domain-containing protein [Thermoanaerobaculia bacterium]
MDPWLEIFARANFQRSADTAHDLKTPLNVAVLNLELLRMRLRKLSDGEEDEKIGGYTRAIENELRRMGRIFDAFFLLSTPPKNEGAPIALDIAPICVDAAASYGFTVKNGAPAYVVVHESRIRQALKLFFEGASRIIDESERHCSTSHDANTFHVLVSGTSLSTETDLPKLFKFYYTDPQGNPDLSLAVARLIAETYGGELSAADDRDKVTLRLSLPLGAQ